ncbi:MAG: DegT/DnrJ/EryC1/StrS family aminotransferase [Pirellulales bacterium]
MPHNEQAAAVVPIVDLKAQLAPLRDELFAAIRQVVDSGYFILGPEVEALESVIADNCLCGHAIGVSSGTDALLMALMAIGVGPGDEIVTTPFSFFSTAGSIARLGARPIFVDVEPDTFNIDPDRIEAAVTSKTKAILPVHLFGQVAEMEPILDIADRHGLRVIEDAAQALGAEYQGRRAGSFGDIACLSFFPTKNVGAMGDAGAVVTDDFQLAERLRMLRNHGFGKKYQAQVLGGNFRLDAIQAAVLRVKMRYLDVWNESRRANAAQYAQLFDEFGIASDQVKLPCEADTRRHIFHQFVVRVGKDRREELQRFLAERSIGSEIYYPLSLHLQECFTHLGYQAGDFPASERATAEVLALPIYAELTADQQRHVVQAVADFV